MSFRYLQSIAVYYYMHKTIRGLIIFCVYISIYVAQPITTLQEASHSALSIHSATLTWHRCHTENGSPPHSSLGGGDTAEPGGHSQPQSCTTTSQWRLFNINLFVPPVSVVSLIQAFNTQCSAEQYLVHVCI